MIYQYVVTLKKEKRKTVDIISVLVLIISGICFLKLITDAKSSMPIFIVSVLVIAAGLCWNLYQHKKGFNVFFGRLLLVAGITWFAMPYMPWLGIPVLLLAFLEKPAKLPLEIGFSDDRVVFNNLVRRKFAWQDFNSILLKDGMLTLDFKNNKLIQKETIDDESDADEEEFNKYCITRMREAG